MRNLLLLSAIALLATGCASMTKPVALVPAPSADTAAHVLSTSSRHGEWVDVALPGSDVKIKSWVVYPERKSKAGVVIVIHEIFGMTDWVRSVADNVAANGYIAIAPDLLSGMGPNGGGTESLQANQVGQMIRQINADEQAKRIDAVREYAIKLPAANGKSATVGFCWGGGASFAYAAHQPKLNGAVVYYGTPPNADGMNKVSCPVLGLYGGNDARITSTVEPTKKFMADLKKPYMTHVYEGAGHGFLRQQNTPETPNAKAAAEAWPTTIAFFRANLE
jgi:carboxymethylenebutenolidase